MRNKKVAAALLTVCMTAGILSGCANGTNIDPNATFATLDDTTIIMGVANFCAKYEQAMYDSFYRSYFGEDMWNSDMSGTGSTMTDDVKSGVVDNIQQLYVLDAHKDEYGVSVTAEEDAAMDAAVDEFIAANSKKAIKLIGAENKENAKEMLRLNTVSKKMYDAITAEAEVEVTDEEAAQRTFSYVVMDTTGTYDENSNLVEYTEEEKEELKVIATTISACDDFETTVENSGYTVSTASYGSAADTDTTFDVAVLEAADALSEGEISNVIETDSALYVLRLDKEYDEEASAAKKEQLIQQKKDEYYNDIVSGWKDASTYTVNEEEWAKVNFDRPFAAPAVEETETATTEE